MASLCLPLFYITGQELWKKFKKKFQVFCLLLTDFFVSHILRMEYVVT